MALTTAKITEYLKDSDALERDVDSLSVEDLLILYEELDAQRSSIWADVKSNEAYDPDSGFSVKEHSDWVHRAYRAHRGASVSRRCVGRRLCELGAFPKLDELEFLVESLRAMIKNRDKQLKKLREDAGVSGYIECLKRTEEKLHNSKMICRNLAKVNEYLSSEAVKAERVTEEHLYSLCLKEAVKTLPKEQRNDLYRMAKALLIERATEAVGECATTCP